MSRVNVRKFLHPSFLLPSFMHHGHALGSWACPSRVGRRRRASASPPRSAAGRSLCHVVLSCPIFGAEDGKTTIYQSLQNFETLARTARLPETARLRGKLWPALSRRVPKTQWPLAPSCFYWASGEYGSEPPTGLSSSRLDFAFGQLQRRQGSARLVKLGGGGAFGLISPRAAVAQGLCRRSRALSQCQIRLWRPRYRALGPSRAILRWR